MHARAALSTLQTLAHGIGSIYFLNGTVAGILLLAAAFANPPATTCGLLALLSAQLFMRFAGFPAQSATFPVYVYNPLLCGMAVGARYALGVPTLTLALIAGLLTVALTVMLTNLFSTRHNLPVISLPFALAAIIICLASSTYVNMKPPTPTWTHMLADTGASLHPVLHLWIRAYFESFGGLIFAPYVFVGALLAITTLCASRILFFLSLLGFFSGTLFHGLLTGDFNAALTGHDTYNYILIAMATGGVFLVPSLQSYAHAILAVLLGVLFMNALNRVAGAENMLVFTMPFNMVTLLILFVLKIAGSRLIPTFIGSTPEHTLERFVSDKLRFQGPELAIGLPFSGAWTVWQGTDGEWTHKGDWKHAFDFVITNNKGLTHVNDGTRLTDYLAWRKPVLSPVSGYVVAVENGLPDNPVGQNNSINNWGNHVILRSESGHFIELSHFAQGSIHVDLGQHVQRGTVLGLCGNSGYSPEPHIHVHAQISSELGAKTLPFGFKGYVLNNAYHHAGVPKKNNVITSLFPDPRLERATTPVLERSYIYELRQQGSSTVQQTLRVDMAPDGNYLLRTAKGKLVFGRREDTHFIYSTQGNDPLLNALFVALPSLPLAQRGNMHWQDSIPASLAVNINRTRGKNTIPRFLRAQSLGFFAAFIPSWAAARAKHTYVSPTTIRTKIEMDHMNIHEYFDVELGDAPVPVEISSANIHIRLKEGEQCAESSQHTIETRRPLSQNSFHFQGTNTERL